MVVMKEAEDARGGGAMESEVWRQVVQWQGLTERKWVRKITH